MDSWVLQPIANPLVLTLAIAVVIALMLLGPAFGQLARPRRTTLMLVRLGVILMALLAMLRPGCVQKVQKNQSAVLLVLVDVTRSMELPHFSDESSRWGALKETIQENQKLLMQLREQKIDVRFFAFDSQVTPIEFAEGNVDLPKVPAGSETDIGSALYKTSIDARDQRLVGVVLCSDGVQNATDPEIELTRAADTLSDLEVPLYTMTFGLSGNTGQVADIAIKNLMEQHRVRVNNRLRIRATLVARGFANQKVNVQLLVTDEEGIETMVGPPKIVTPTKAYEEIQVQLDYVPPEVGEFRLKVRAKPLPGEVALRNNELPSFLTVQEGGLRVLYIEGKLDYEQMELQRAIQSAAQGIDLEFILIYPHTQNRWPYRQPLVDYFRDPTIDVFVIGDVDSRALYDPQEWTESLDALADAVEAGKGLMMLGGYHSFGPGLYHQTPLADLLPVEMDSSEAQELGGSVRRDLHIERRLKLKPTRDHYVTRLNYDGSSGEKWAELPELLGANYFVGIKDNALVLLESDDNAKNPILVSGLAGGRVLAFAGDTTWRWKWHGFEEEYNAFWRQAIFYLAKWDGKSGDNVWVRLTQRRYQPRSAISFLTGARTLEGAEIPDAEFDVSLLKPNGNEISLTASRTSEGNRVKIDPDAVVNAGVYTVRVTGRRGNEEIGRTESEFVIVDRDKEKAIPAADPEQMLRLANQTAEFGGRAVSPEKFSDLLKEISENPPETVIEVPTKWRLGESLPDALAYLVAFVGLLALEWFLRKKWGLV